MCSSDLPEVRVAAETILVDLMAKAALLVAPRNAAPDDVERLLARETPQNTPLGLREAIGGETAAQWQA